MISPKSSIFVIISILVIGCGSSPGPDSISSHRSEGASSVPDCTVCHSSPSLDPLVTNGSETKGKHIAHVKDAGIACIKCHFGYSDRATHMNGIMDTPDPAVLIVYFDSTNKNGQWINDGGPQQGSCKSLACHGSETPDWYGPGGGPLHGCSFCHSAAINIRRQILGAGGDFGANTALLSHHVAGASDPSGEQCMVCHDQSTHMSGTVRLKHADTGESFVYDPAHSSSLEPFCLSCHDMNGANGNFSPFSDGRTLGVIPHEAGTRIADYWNSTNTVHKQNGLTCAGTGEIGTGCHGNNGVINMHGSVSVGLLTKNMTLPVLPTPDGQPPAPYDYNDYKLCFDCHAAYPSVTKEVVLGYAQGGNYDVWWAPTPYYTSGIQSLFRDRYISSSGNYPTYWNGMNQTYNDTVWGDAYTPLHNYHMSYGDSMMKYIWKYRGITLGRASCIACHNVHGAAGKSVRSTYDEFGITAFSKTFPSGETDGYKKFVPDSNYDDTIMMTYPINCYQSCHGIAGPTSYWNTPSGE